MYTITLSIFSEQFLIALYSKFIEFPVIYIIRKFTCYTRILAVKNKRAKQDSILLISIRS